MTSNIKQQTRDFIQANFMMGGAADFPDDASFMEMHLVDSTGFLELISFLENTFKLKLSDHEMVPENLDSLNGIAHFVETKTAAGAASER